MTSQFPFVVFSKQDMAGRV